MEDLISGFDSSHISLDEADICLIHPRYSQYKVNNLATSQERRRKLWLEDRKEKRSQHLSLFRKISATENEDVADDKMEIDEKKEKKKKQIFKQFKGLLMLSEWLIDIPDDLENNWLCKICPEGKRALVFATEGKTSAYGRNGQRFIYPFSSWLPGGSRLTNKGVTMLDTIFVQSTSTFYILDMLQWNIETVDLEAEMRLFWIESKIADEVPQIGEQCKTNRFKFVVLQAFSYLQLVQKMKIHQVFPNNAPKVDGILFFHRRSFYVHSRSPLVTWLKPFMLPEILRISIAPEYLQEKPSNYSKVKTDDDKLKMVHH